MFAFLFLLKYLLMSIETSCQKSLAGYRARDRKESDTTKRWTGLTFRQKILPCFQGPDGPHSCLIATLKTSQPDLQV